MPSPTPYVAKWGILATGGIAKHFVQDLLSPPSNRGAEDVAHKVVAISSSSSLARAEDFAKEVGLEEHIGHQTKCYGNYQDMVQDPEVQIVYIATPHSLHYQNALLCLEAGKAVCCEKPFTINAKQTAHLIKVAREKNLFLMEAMWTRFIPSVLEIQRLIHEEKIIGDVVRVFSDLSQAFPKDPKHRLYDPELGGGALLDVGIYPLTWQMLTLYQHPDNARCLPEITSTFLPSTLTGVDASTVVVGNYPKLGAQGIATACLNAKTSTAYAVLIQGTKGDIRIPPAPMNPSKFFIELKGKDVEIREFPIPGHGMFYEADAAARCLRDGKKQTDLCRLEEDSLVVMKIMDEVRAKGGFTYPDEIEALRSDA